MKPFTRAVLVLLLAAGLVGCSWQTCFLERKDFDRSDFDRVEPGMGRSAVVKILGKPTDLSKNAMHWERSRYCDVWVFFSAGGRRVTGKYWQDKESLRLDDVLPVRD